jgi:aspartate/methionine/tyrosine aminotransferase
MTTTRQTMAYQRTQARSEYIHWFKLSGSARFNLSGSGILGLPLKELPIQLSDLEISAPGGYGYPPLQRRLAGRYGVPQECIVSAIGTSMANYLAMSAVLEPGDEALIEHPTYDPLLEIARYLGVTTRRLPRTPENGFQVSLQDLERLVTESTRLIVLTNLHNPSGALLAEPALRQIGEIARRHGARVLVDEVYLEMLFHQPVRSSIHLGHHFLVTSSLTKAFGLSGLRCGWILADPELADRMWHQNDLFGNIPSHTAERMSVFALDHFEPISARAEALLTQNRKLLEKFLAANPNLDALRPPGGTILFPRIPGGNADAFCKFLREKYETSVVPGRFFEMPDRIRLGIGGETQEVEEGLNRLSEALRTLRV